MNKTELSLSMWKLNIGKLLRQLRKFDHQQVLNIRNYYILRCDSGVKVTLCQPLIFIGKHWLQLLYVWNLLQNNPGGGERMGYRWSKMGPDLTLKLQDRSRRFSDTRCSNFIHLCIFEMFHNNKLNQYVFRKES